MDAAYNNFKKTALLFATALLSAAPSFATSTVQLSASPSSVSLSSPSVPVPVTVTASAAVDSFTVTPVSATYFAVENQTTTTTTVSFTVRLTSSSCGINPNSSCNGGKITVTGGGGSVDIPVAYGSGGGTGSGTFSAPTAVTLNTFSGGITSNSIQVTTTSATAVSFTISNVTGTWLTVSAAAGYSTQTSSGSPSVLQVGANAAGLPNGTYYGSFLLTPASGTAVTVQVTLVVGTGGTSGYFSPQTTVVSFAYPSGSQSATIYFNNTSAGTYTDSYTPSNSWLTVPTSGTLASGLPISVNTTAAAQLATGNYTGYVYLSDSSTITVNLSINGATNGNFNPSSLSFTASLGSAAQAQTVTVSGATQIIIPDSCNWVGVSQTATNTYQIRVFPSNLSVANVYTCNISFGAPGSLPVTLNLGGSGGGGTTTSGVVAPSNLTFAYTAGGDTPPLQSITVAGTGTYTISTSYTGGSTAFISASGTGTAPGQIGVYVVGGLAAGTYTGAISIVTSSGTQSVGVTLVVSSGAVLISDPGSVNVSWSPGSGTIVRNLNIYASDGSAIAVNLASSASWVTLSQTATTTSANVQVTIDPSSLANGLNTATITVTGGANNTLKIPVVVLVSGSSGSTGNLTLSQSSFTFNGAVSGAQPATQQLTVSTTAAGTNFSASTPTTGCGWLTISPSGSLSTPKTITVSANQAGLAINSYSCNISLTSGGVTQIVPVTLVVSTSGGGGGSGNITANPTSVSFTYMVGDDVPGPKGVVVSSAQGSASVGVTTSVTSGSPWLSVTPASASTQVTLSIMVDPTSLSAGTYNGNVKVTPNGGTAINVPVTLTVTSLSVSASPATLTFSYRAGDPAPAAQTVSVSGGTGLTFSATAASTGNWLQVTPTTGTTPATLSVSIDPTSLTSTGSQVGTIMVSGTGTATGSTTVTVTINVTAPLPTIAGVTNGASFASASTISAGEVITLFGTNIGPATPAGLTLDSSGKVSTILGGVQVLVGGYPAAMIYASGTQVSAVVPYEIASPVFRVSPNVQVKYLNQTSNGVPVTQVTSAPGLFTANSSGTGPGAILNQNSTLNAPGNPANKGDTVVIYMTGEGQTNPLGVTGKVTTVNPAANPLTPQPLLPVAVLIDGQPANVTFFGEAPGLVSGVMQVNVQIPSNARSGALPVTVQVGSNISQNGVTVSVK